MAVHPILGKLFAMRTGAVWMLRLLWFTLPLTVGAVAIDALDATDSTISLVARTGLWVLWAAGLLATAIPVPITLTSLRLVAPGVLAVAAWGAFKTNLSPTAVVGLSHAFWVVLVAFASPIGDRFVDGASYGDERRMLLRPSATVAFMVAPALWVAMAAAVTAGPLLLAAQRWLPGAALTAVAVVVTAVGSRALHQLNRRWIVFVPTGMVLHDLSVLTEPVLFRRTAVERLGPAIVGSPARDVSNGAYGLLLECELTDAAPLGLRNSTKDSGPGATLTDVRRFLFCPSRPGALLDEAERRGLPRRPLTRPDDQLTAAGYRLAWFRSTPKSIRARSAASAAIRAVSGDPCSIARS